MPCTKADRAALTSTGTPAGRRLDPGFASALELARSGHLNGWEPWLPAEALPKPGTDDPYALVRLLHLGAAVSTGAIDSGQAELMTQLGLVRWEDGDRLVPGPWGVTAFRGILAAAHRTYGTATNEVHVGEDSLRFTAAVLEAAPTGRVLDVGCGSGIASMAAARTAQEVFGIDVLEEAVDAFRISTRLNAPAIACRAEPGDFRELQGGDEFDTVVANLPGVPVPSGVPYPTAGDGGADGLRLIRALWHWFVDQAPADNLLMRFQCPGDQRVSTAVAELDGLLPPRADILVTTDTAVPMMIRNAITAARAATLSNGRTAQEIFDVLQQRCAEQGWTHYHCATLRVRRNGAGLRRHLPAPTRMAPDQTYRYAGRQLSAAAVTLQVGAALRQTPDEFWSVDGMTAIASAIGELESIYSALGDGATGREVAMSLSEPRCPLRGHQSITW